MGSSQKEHRVKLITGLIYRDSQQYLAIKPFLLRAFGAVDFESPEIPFNYTDYYKNEFGDGLTRRFVSFSRLISPAALAAIKIRTNRLEQKQARRGKRTVNIDPGYIDMAKLVLASTKDFCHRIYLDKGIFAEITLVYKKDSFTFWDWTYPDYRTKEYISIFNRIRHMYAQQL
jgi:hypothetical protein